MLQIYTDGACSGNPGKGGWAWHIHGSNIQNSGHKVRTTNNEMELQAIESAIHYLNGIGCTKAKIYSDSSYCIEGCKSWVFGWAKKGWKTSTGSDVKNLELWKSIYEMLSGPCLIEFIKVKGHSGNAGNELADKLAVTAMNRG